MEKPQEAERIIHQLVEREPADYLKLLELLDVYLRTDDLESAIRILLVTSEQLLISGKSENLKNWLNEILLRNPEHLDALRLFVRYQSWQRDEAELRSALERLAEAARMNNSFDDERYALSQLVVMIPQELAFAQRLQEINTEHGFVEVESIVNLDREQETVEAKEIEPDDINVQIFEHFAVVPNESGLPTTITSFEKFENFYSGENGSHEQTSADWLENGSPGNFEEVPTFEEVTDEEKAAPVEAETPDAEQSAERKLTLTEEMLLQRELEGVEFYLAQGYRELAEKTLNKLEEEFGSQTELAAFRAKMDDSDQLPAEESQPEPEDFDIPEELPAPAEIAEKPEIPHLDLMNDFRNELGLEESEPPADDYDYDTHYQLAIAYKEMGLMEDAIKEFQDAINLSKPDDGTPRFFQCANLLGFCFMEQQMPNLALMWYGRALETENLGEEQTEALHYEIGNAYEAGGDLEKARSYFEQVYVANVDYRDVSKRLQNLQEKVH